VNTSFIQIKKIIISNFFTKLINQVLGIITPILNPYYKGYQYLTFGIILKTTYQILDFKEDNDKNLFKEAVNNQIVSFFLKSRNEKIFIIYQFFTKPP